MTTQTETPAATSETYLNINEASKACGLEPVRAAHLGIALWLAKPQTQRQRLSRLQHAFDR